MRREQWQPGDPPRPAETLTEAARLERDRLIWRYRERCWSTSAIVEVLAREHGFEITEAGVLQVVARLASQLHDRFLGQVQQERLMQAAQLEHQAMRALEEFERSCQTAEMVVTTTGRASLSRDGEVVPLPDQVVTTRKPQAGNPALLLAATQCLASIRDLFGYNAPEKLRVEADHRSVSMRLDSKLEELAARLAPDQVALGEGEGDGGGGNGSSTSE